MSESDFDNFIKYTPKEYVEYFDSLEESFSEFEGDSLRDAKPSWFMAMHYVNLGFVQIDHLSSKWALNFYTQGATREVKFSLTDLGKEFQVALVILFVRESRE